MRLSCRTLSYVVSPSLGDPSHRFLTRADGFYVTDHAKVFNDVIYTTGQIGGDVTGKLVSNEVGAQAEQMFANLSAILEAAGSSLDRVLTANIYLTDSANYAALNEVYTRVG